LAIKIPLPDGQPTARSPSAAACNGSSGGSPPGLFEEEGRPGRGTYLMTEGLVNPNNVVELQLLLAAKYNIRIK